MKDYKTHREIDIKEKVLVVGKKVYAKESYIAFNTEELEGYPPRVYYDREDIYLGKMYDEGIYELEDIEDIVSVFVNSCYYYTDVEEIRSYLINQRKKFFEKLEEK
jgi:hypothetical protein